MGAAIVSRKQKSQTRSGGIRIRPGGYRGHSHLSGEVRTEASRLGVGEVGGRAQTLNSLGKHLLLEYYECDVNSINDVTRVEQNLNDAAEACGATIIKSVFHGFNPIGVSGVVVISESHLAIHTWPEHGFAAVDVFTCGDTVDPHVAHALLKERFGAQKVKIMEVKRGNLRKPSKVVKVVGDRATAG